MFLYIISEIFHALRLFDIYFNRKLFADIKILHKYSFTSSYVLLVAINMKNFGIALSVTFIKIIELSKKETFIVPV